MIKYQGPLTKCEYTIRRQWDLKGVNLWIDTEIYVIRLYIPHGSKYNVFVPFLANLNNDYYLIAALKF